MKLTWLVDDYLSHLAAERGLSPNTTSSYRRDLGRYTAFLGERGIEEICDVTRLEVGAFTGYLVGGDGKHAPLAHSSVARAVVAVRNLHKFALEEGVVADDVAADVSPPKIADRLPKALSLDQTEALLAVPDRDDAIGMRDACLLELLYGTGARISELCALDVDDVTAALADLNVGLRLVGKGGKERIVPLGSFARAAIEAWIVRGRQAVATRARRTSSALLLNSRGARLSRQSAWAVLQSAADKANLAVDVSPHTLRHTFATHLLDGGADVRIVQELLGHASVATTQIYTLVTADHLREVYAASHPRAHWRSAR